MSTAARTPSAGPSAERRNWARHVTASGIQAILATPVKGPVPVTVQDISQGGARLLVPQKVDAGTAARLELSRPSGNVQVAAELVVVYIIGQAHGGFLAGAAFAQPLTDAELNALL